MKCPNCDANLDAHVGIGYNDRSPAPGDILLCAHCRTPLIVNPDHTLHVMSALEKALLSKQEQADLDFASRLPKPK